MWSTVKSELRESTEYLSLCFLFMKKWLRLANLHSKRGMAEDDRRGKGGSSFGGSNKRAVARNVDERHDWSAGSAVHMVQQGTHPRWACRGQPFCSRGCHRPCASMDTASKTADEWNFHELSQCMRRDCSGAVSYEAAQHGYHS